MKKYKEKKNEEVQGEEEEWRSTRKSRGEEEWRSTRRSRGMKNEEIRGLKNEEGTRSREVQEQVKKKNFKKIL